MKISPLTQQIFDHLFNTMALLAFVEEDGILDIAHSLVRETCNDKDLAYLGQDLAAALVAYTRHQKDND